jgi:hypothetical protein
LFLFALLWLACVLPVDGKPAHSLADQQAGLQRLFRDIDKNADGQLDELETAQFAAASLDLKQEGWSAQAAQAASRAVLDGPDAGATVSEAELAAHLVALLQVTLGPRCPQALVMEAEGQDHCFASRFAHPAQG